MLQIQNVTYSIGDRNLLSGITWAIRSGKRAALIGPNGAGKTTLFRIIHGDLQPYAGSIIKPKGYRIGYLPQEEVTVGSGSLLRVVLEGRRDILDIEAKINTLHSALEESPANSQSLLHQLSQLQEQYTALDGFRMESLAKSILSGLGFSNPDFARPLSDFSGGWRMRAYLARILIQNPDLLLLDEPTNHLDLPALEWLEQFLLNFSGSMIIVSHDRFFIDRLAEEIYELNRGSLEFYAGNYHFYESERNKREDLLRKKWEEQQEERKRQERFISRFRYKASKASQVQSRIKTLEKMETIEIPPPLPRSINFNISVETQSYKDVLTIEDMSFRYDEPWVLQRINLKIYRGEKMALVGANGAGKTTFTKLIAGQLASSDGEIQIGKGTKIGYYAQHQVDALNLQATVYDEVSAHVSNHNFPRIRNILGLFQFTGDDVYKKIEVLSGGEKARVSLAKILLSPVNFLMMDEPTNHLDIASKEALENALSNYDGTLLLISHDRYFLDKLVHRVIEVQDHHIKEYEGNYTDYLERRETDAPELMKTITEAAEKSTVKKSKEQKRTEAEARQVISKQRSRLTHEIETLELNIYELETRKSELEVQLSLPETYQNGALIVSVQKEYSEIKLKLDRCYPKWEALHEKMNQLLNEI